MLVIVVLGKFVNCLETELRSLILVAIIKEVNLINNVFSSKIKENILLSQLNELIARRCSLEARVTKKNYKASCYYAPDITPWWYNVHVFPEYINVY